MALQTTLGQILVNETLPKEMRSYDRVLDKKGVRSVLQEIAEKHPDQYREVSYKLTKLGEELSYQSGGYSFGLRDLLPTPSSLRAQTKVNAETEKILAGAGTDDEKSEAIIKMTSKIFTPLDKEILAETVASRNPLGLQVLSGSRGSASSLKTLLAGDGLYTDHRDRVIPIPITRSYSQGLSPAEYMAASFGARRGLVETKLSVSQGGFLAKQLVQATHRLVVSKMDADEEDGDYTANQQTARRGLPVDTDDPDNAGALLAYPVGGYKRNTLLTTRVLQDLSEQGLKRIIVRSPISGGASDGGLYARDVGVREFGNLPSRGTMVGITASQAVSEPATQGTLGAKHSGGIATGQSATSGLQFLSRLTQVPKVSPEWAAHAQEDGRVTHVKEAPAGGQYVVIGGRDHYVGPKQQVTAKVGDVFEAGDLLSDGVANPSEVVRWKGIGEGRRVLMVTLRSALDRGGTGANRRNLELLARGLVNHVEITDETSDHSAGDIVPYDVMERDWKPRVGSRETSPSGGIGKYLETPVLHYSIGTPIRRSTAKELESFGIKDIRVHDEAPPFQPRMIRALDNVSSDPDWMTRFLGSGLKKSLSKATHSGAVANLDGTSFVASLALEPVRFGSIGGVINDYKPTQPISVAPGGTI